MSKRNDYNNGGFVTPDTGKSELLTLVNQLKDMVENLGKLLLVTPPSLPELNNLVEKTND